MELWKRRILTNEDISRIIGKVSSDGAAINFELFSFFFFFLYSVEGTKKPFF